MADEVTPYLGLVKPEVNGEQTENVWGFDLNANFDKIDAKLAELPTTDAPLDGDIYGRRQGAWSRTVMKTDFDALVTATAAIKSHDDAQDAIITNHDHVAADITDFAETVQDDVAAMLVAGPNITLGYDDPTGKLTIASSGGGSGGGGAPLVDGDYGDITVSGTGLIWRIDPQAVTYAKIQNVTADKLLGAVAAGTMQEIVCTAAGRAILDDADAAAQRTTLGINLTTLQPVDPTLTALAALTGNGLVEQTGVDIFAKRAVGAATDTDIPDRFAADNRYQLKDQTLTSLSFLDATAGLLEQTGQDVFAKRAIGVAATTSIPTRADGDARWALLDSPVFIGDARAVTPAPADNDTSIATTAFVKQTAASAIGDTPPVDVWQGRTWWESDTGKFFMSYNDGNTTQWVHLNGPVIDSYDKAAADAKFVDVAGDTMTGALVAPGFNLSLGGGLGNISGANGYTTISDGSGNIAIHLGGTIINTNYYNNGTHYIRSRDGNTNYAVIDATKVDIKQTTASTSPTTGALTVAGGVGISGRLTGAQACLGTTSFSGATTPLSIAFNGAVAYGIALRTATDNCINIGFHNAAATLCGSISTSPTTTSYTTSSSAELKEDLQSFDAGRIVDDTEVYDFKWKNVDERSYGVIAQQAVEVYPQAITHDEEQDWWGVDYSKYVPVILQELKALRARVAELEGKPLAPKKGH
jgi:hypothetical protein